MINRLLSTIISGLRPLLGPASCYFEETCTPFALRMLQEKPLHHALFAIVRRLLACNPIAAFIKNRRKLVMSALVSCLWFSMSIATPLSWLYTASGCNPELIRNRNTIHNFLRELSQLVESTPNGLPTINHGQNGFTGVQILDGGSTITTTVINNNNSVHVNLLLLHSPKTKKIVPLIKKWFEAQSIINNN